MANLNNNIISTTTTGSINSLLYTGTDISSGSYNVSLSNEMTDFFDLVLAALGHDITYEKFSKITQEERNQIIRDIKLKTIL